MRATLTPFTIVLVRAKSGIRLAGDMKAGTLGEDPTQPRAYVDVFSRGLLEVEAFQSS
jgi:hypothetical protein